jgi:2-polyprenyl-3-methyl-5-hydroxy-6-metoxy-1,4-benzoquinol methylase
MYIYQDKVSSPEKKLENLNFDWKDKSVIELGCNIGKLGMYVMKLGAKSYKGFDIDKNMIKEGINRYALDLVTTDVVDCEEDYEADVVIIMALFHHFNDKDLEKVVSKINSEELIFEVPIGKSGTGLYYERTKQDYIKMIRKLYGKVVEIVDSGATNDPYNKRVIFYCKKYVQTKSIKEIF